MKMKKCLRALLSMTVVVTGFSLFLNAAQKPPKPTMMQRISTAATGVKTAITSRLPGGSSRVSVVRDEGHSSRASSPSLRDRASGAVQSARGAVEAKVSGVRAAVDKKVESGLGHVSEGARAASGKIGELQGNVAADSRAGNARGLREVSTSSKTSDSSKKESKSALNRKKVEDLKESGKQLKKDVVRKGKEVRSDVERKGREVRRNVEKKAEGALKFVNKKAEAASSRIDKLIESNKENPRIQKFLETVKKGLGTVSVNARLKKENLKKDRAERSVNRHTQKIKKIEAQILKAREEGDDKRVGKLEESLKGRKSKKAAAEKRLERSEEKVSALGKVRDAQKTQKTAGVEAGGEQSADALDQEGKKGMSTKKKVAIGAGVAAVGLAGLVASQKTPEEGGAEGEAPVPAAE